MRRKRNPLPGVGMWLDVAWLWLDVLYTEVDLNSFIWFFLANLSRTPCWSFAEPMLSNNSSYQDSFITCQITPYCHGSPLHSLVNMQLASRNPLFRTGYCWPGNFFWKAYWAHSFAELSRKYPYPQTQPSAGGRIRGKSKHQGPWRLALAKPHFWKLACCIWSLFLETSESNVRQYQRQVQGFASGPWYLAVATPHLRKLGCYLCRER